MRCALAVLLSLLAVAPAAHAQAVAPLLPSSDADRDGVRLADDRCPASPPGRAVLLGCTTLDLLVDPGPAAAQVRAGLDPQSAIAKALTSLAGRPACSSGPALRALRRRVPASLEALAKARRTAPGRRLGLTADLRAARRLTEGLVRACAGAQPTKLDPRQVVSLDPGRAFARLAGGTTLLLGAAVDGTAVLPGSVVRAEGTKIGGGIVLARRVDVEQLQDAVGPCRVTLRVVPVQAPAAAPVVHGLAGYQEPSGRLVLEEGSGLRAVLGPECAGTFPRYAVDVRIADAGSGGAATFLGSLSGSASEPALRVPRIPAGAVGKNPRLSVRVVGLPCPAGQPCRRGVRLTDAGQSPAVTVIPPGGAGEVSLGGMTYAGAPDPGDGEGFGGRLDPLVRKTPPGIPFDASPVVFGYAGFGDGRPGFPQVSRIDDADNRVRVFADVPSVLDPTGVLAAQAVGTRNGAPYSYSAAAKELLRIDMLDACDGTPVSSYALPIPKTPSDTVNIGGVSANGGLLELRFYQPGTHDVTAARGGIVREVLQHDGRWTARIEHLDGESTTYSGLGARPKVQPGEEVDRGTLLGFVPPKPKGNGTFSTLELRVEGPFGPTRARYEARTFGSGVGLRCHLPKAGETLRGSVPVFPEEAPTGEVPR